MQIEEKFGILSKVKILRDKTIVKLCKITDCLFKALEKIDLSTNENLNIEADDKSSMHEDTQNNEENKDSDYCIDSDSHSNSEEHRILKENRRKRIFGDDQHFYHERFVRLKRSATKELNLVGRIVRTLE